jgi:hypothetical protein
MASDHFDVTVRDLAGHSVTVDCTPDTPISHLINKFRERLPYIENKRKFILTKKGSPDELTGTLRDNDITGIINDEIILFVVYTGWGPDMIKCINREPIIEKLHHWIEDKIKFKAGKIPAHKDNIDCTALVTEHNNWTVDTECLFFLTMNQPSEFKTWESESIIMPAPNKKDDPYVGPIEYQSGMDYKKRTHAHMYYYYSKKLDAERQMLIPKNMAHIRGTLYKIIINITNKKDSSTGYKREFEIYVVLKGPIEIYEPDGTVKYSSDDPTALCLVQYDSIMMCNSKGELNIPNNSQGGRRAKQTKRTKRTKRSKNKRKMIRRTHKKRA